MYTPGVARAIAPARSTAAGPPWVSTWIGNTTPLGTPWRSRACRVCAGCPLPPSELARGWPVFIDRAGAASPSTIATPRTPATQRRRTTILPQDSHLRLKVVDPERTRRLSSAGPHETSITGSSVTAAVIATSGISIPPRPMLRRNGTGRSTRESSPTATVAPLSTTARPAVGAEASIASSLERPASRSSRQRAMSSSE